MPTLTYEELNFSQKGESSNGIRNRVLTARTIQLERFSVSHTAYNANMTHKEVENYCGLDQEGHDLLSNALQKYKLSGRAHDSILKVARTIADLEGSDSIKVWHLAEAVTYRCLDKEVNF